MKLCGPYLNTKTGYPWADAAKTARALAAYAPERMLWGTDFPHVTEKVKPDEWSLLETIDAWFDTDHAKRLALVENPGAGVWILGRLIERKRNYDPEKTGHGPELWSPAMFRSRCAPIPTAACS